MSVRNEMDRRRQGTVMSFQRRERLRALMERDGRTCQHCRREVVVVKIKQGKRQPRNAATEDHIKPKSAGGGDELANLLLSCFDCNNRRGDLPVDVFRVRNGFKCEGGE